MHTDSGATELSYKVLFSINICVAISSSVLGFMRAQAGPRPTLMMIPSTSPDEPEHPAEDRSAPGIAVVMRRESVEVGMMSLEAAVAAAAAVWRGVHGTAVINEIPGKGSPM
jgi:hypothetical protein